MGGGGDITDARDCQGVDLYLAGPPCQPWSLNNTAAAEENDPRGQLFNASVSFICEARPRAFIIENVCGLASKSGGRYLTDVLRRIKDRGHHATWARMSPREMGLPQNRPRVYVWRLRTGLAPRLPEIATQRRPMCLHWQTSLHQDAFYRNGSAWTLRSTYHPRQRNVCARLLRARPRHNWARSTGWWTTRCPEGGMAPAER